MTALLASVLLAATPPLVLLETYSLPNGLTVTLARDTRLPTVGIDLWYHVGAANETAGKSGFAHLFEHLMFQGSKHRQGNEQDLFGLVESAGSSDLNASTWNDRTNYYETLPANQLELGLWLESERMAFLLDGLDQKKLDTQRAVVRNERRQSIENTPYGKADVRIVELLFPSPHPYHGAVIGSHEDLEAATLDDVKAFFRTYYVPANASLVIAGDFEPARARALVEKYFGPIPRAPRPAPPAIHTLPITRQIRETLTDDVQLSRLLVGVIAPPAASDAAFVWDVVQEILSGGKTSRLYRSLVFERRVAQEVDMSTDQSTFGSASVIRVTLTPGHLPAEAEALLDAELDRISSSPPTDAELRRAQRNIVARFYRALERLNGNGARADLLNAFQLWRGDPGFVNQVVGRIRGITAAQVQESARRTLGADGRVVLVVNPAARTVSAR